MVWNNLAFCDEIHDAAAAGDLEKVKALLKENPADVNARDSLNGATPLVVAVINNHKDMVELLLANNADVNAKTFFGMTPLHYVENEDVAELLLVNKADVNAKDKGGENTFACGGN